MINALYLVTFNEGVSPEEKTAMRDEARAACEAVAPAWLCDIVPDDSPTNAGDLFCELAFADRTAYEEAAGSPSWESLREAVSDSSLAADVTFLAYGPGQANLKGGDSTCHRIMLMHLVEGVDPKMVEAMTQRVLQVADIRGFRLQRRGAVELCLRLRFRCGRYVPGQVHDLSLPLGLSAARAV